MLFPPTGGARAGSGEPAGTDELRRENQELPAELLETKLGLRGALQYVLLLFHQELARQAQLVTAPDLGASSSTPSADGEVAADPAGQGVGRLRSELRQAKAELDPVHWLLRTVLDGVGSVGAEARTRLRDCYSAGAHRRTHEYREPRRGSSIGRG